MGIYLTIAMQHATIKSFYSLWSTGHPWRASRHCGLQLSSWPRSMIFLCFLSHPILSFATFSLAYLSFYIPEDSNLMQFSLLLLLLYVMCVQSKSIFFFLSDFLLTSDGWFSTLPTNWWFYITYSMEKSPSWEANQFAASQEIPRILWNPKVHYRVDKSPPPDLIISPIMSYQKISRGSRHMYPFRNKASFYGEELMALRPTPKPENHPLLAVRDFIQNIHNYLAYCRPFLHPQPEDAVTGTHLSWNDFRLVCAN